MDGRQRHRLGDPWWDNATLIELIPCLTQLASLSRHRVEEDRNGNIHFLFVDSLAGDPSLQRPTQLICRLYSFFFVFVPPFTPKSRCGSAIFVFTWRSGGLIIKVLDSAVSQAKFFIGPFFCPLIAREGERQSRANAKSKETSVSATTSRAGFHIELRAFGNRAALREATELSENAGVDPVELCGDGCGVTQSGRPFLGSLKLSIGSKRRQGIDSEDPFKPRSQSG